MDFTIPEIIKRVVAENGMTVEDAMTALVSALVDVHSPGVPMARLWALRAALGTRAGQVLLDRMIALDPRRWVHRNVHYRDESLKSLEEAEEYGRPLDTPEGRAALGRHYGKSPGPAQRPPDRG